MYLLIIVSDFYSNCNSVEVPFKDDDHRVLFNSKYSNNNELNALKPKQNNFDIIHLSTASLKKRYPFRFINFDATKFCSYRFK